MRDDWRDARLTESPLDYWRVSRLTEHPSLLEITMKDDLIGLLVISGLGILLGTMLGLSV